LDARQIRGTLREKKIGKYWFYAGKNSGVGFGIHVDKYHVTIDFLFWYVGWEF